MSTKSLEVMTVRWSQVDPSLAEWRRRTRPRNELMGLSNRVLQDIGMSRGAADFAASTPLWQA